MGYENTHTINDADLQIELVAHYIKIKKLGRRMNILGEEMVKRKLLKDYTRVTYPNIWDHGMAVEA